MPRFHLNDVISLWKYNGNHQTIAQINSLNGLWHVGLEDVQLFFAVVRCIDARPLKIQMLSQLISFDSIRKCCFTMREA